MKLNSKAFRIIAGFWSLIFVLVGLAIAHGGDKGMSPIGLLVGLPMMVGSFYLFWKIINGEDSVTKSLEAIEQRTQVGQDNTPHLRVPTQLKRAKLDPVVLGMVVGLAVFWFMLVKSGTPVGRGMSGLVLLAGLMAYDICQFKIRGTKLRRNGILPFFRQEIDLRHVRGYSFKWKRHGDKKVSITGVTFYDSSGIKMMTVSFFIYDGQFLIDWLKQYHVDQDDLDGLFKKSGTGG